MDSAALTELARQLLLGSAPLIAGGALTRIGEATVEESAAWLARARERLGSWLSGRKAGEAALALYEAEPNDADARRPLEKQLVTVLQHDSAAATELAALVEALRRLQGGAAPTGNTQTFGNNTNIVNNVAGSVYGSISVGNVDQRRSVVQAAPRKKRAKISVPTPQSDDLATLSSDGVHFSHGYALLIGVGHYAHSPLSVPATAQDAERLAAVLRDRAVAAYPPAQVVVLRDQAATRDAILTAFDDLALKLIGDPKATALIFFAGHGMEEGAQYYLLPYDYRPSQLAASAIDAAIFRERLHVPKDRAARLLVLLNCCHAGGVGDRVLSAAAEEPAPSAPPASFLDPLVEGSGRVVITSSQASERSGTWKSETVFGKQLLAALKGEAPGVGAGVGVLELFAYLSTTVPQAARAITDPHTSLPLEQHPLLYAQRLDHDFALTLRPPERRRGTMGHALAAAIQRLVDIELELAELGNAAAADMIAERERLRKEIGL